MGQQIHGSISDPILRQILRAEGLKQLVLIPLTADDDWFKAVVNPTGTSGGETITVDTWTNAECPAWPVCPVLEYTEVSGSDVTGIQATVRGTDQFGDFVTEEIALAFDSTSGTWLATTKNAFAKLAEVVAVVTGTTASDDTFKIGFDKTYGFGAKLESADDVIARLFNQAKDAGTIDAANSTYKIAGTPDSQITFFTCFRPGYYLHV